MESQKEITAYKFCNGITEKITHETFLPFHV